LFSIVKNPGQSKPQVSGLHGIIGGGKVIVPHKSQPMQEVLVQYENPCTLDPECQESVQKGESTQGVFILQMEYTAGRHVGIGLVFGGVVNIKSKIRHQGPLEQGLLPVVGGVERGNGEFEYLTRRGVLEQDLIFRVKARYGEMPGKIARKNQEVLIIKAGKGFLVPVYIVGDVGDTGPDIRFPVLAVDKGFSP
jgi:hypothetical protein